MYFATRGKPSIPRMENRFSSVAILELVQLLSGLLVQVCGYAACWYMPAMGPSNQQVAQLCIVFFVRVFVAAYRITLYTYIRINCGIRLWAIFHFSFVVQLQVNYIHKLQIPPPSRHEADFDDGTILVLLFFDIALRYRVTEWPFRSFVVFILLLRYVSFRCYFIFV